MRKLSRGAPPIATQRTSGATDWLIASRPQGNAYGHRSLIPSTRTHQPATATGQYGRFSSSRCPMASTARMTASAPASAAHAYQASLISQDSRGTNAARPNTSPQPNDARRLRPASATTSSPGATAASGHASTGGNDAYSASPPATEISSAQRVLNPAKLPTPPVRASASDAAWALFSRSPPGRPEALLVPLAAGRPESVSSLLAPPPLVSPDTDAPFGSRERAGSVTAAA